MTKQIISLSLSKEAIDVLDKISAALGKSRSEFVEWVVTEGFKLNPEIQKRVEAITELQEKIKELAS